ncbi:MAG: 2OG-Fe(II) oxygenase [Pseudomonadota bacterium]|uniref:2OG-Fe(II) oxygenase n=1 Tax=Phenylobacterium sp. TaxID=1871053 RepID=UPI0025E1472B|nr:2OG-Fe(II) oxygenase [Phenylobacterium sp.]MBT9470950.1 2OG-Fe(II) oxygenase [Phenylobacterium sp.]
MSLTPGQAAPWFTAPTKANPRFAFSSLAGRYVLLLFTPDDPAQRETALARLAAAEAQFDQVNQIAFCVTRDPAVFQAARETLGVRWFLDANDQITRGYGAVDAAGTEQPQWLILDPTLRVLVTGTMADSDRIFAALGGLPSPNDHAGVPLHAPVLIVPRVFEPEMCRRLINFYDQTGGAPSGVMREIDGKTVGVLDDFKRRSDATIEDPAFRAEILRRIEKRLVSQINRAFQFQPTRIERYIVARYDADEGGYFRAHRDNTTAGTAHRRFACSINLNAEEFEGGDLRFPEFGSRTYRPPSGGAVVFSCSLLHEATPVTRGRRYAFLPFFYDEAGEEIRQKNLHTLVLPPEATGISSD